MAVCTTCSGSGEISEYVREDCEFCEGTGTVIGLTCDACSGLGMAVNKNITCPSCKGTGTERDLEPVVRPVAIPKSGLFNKNSRHTSKSVEIPASIKKINSEQKPKSKTFLNSFYYDAIRLLSMAVAVGLGYLIYKAGGTPGQFLLIPFLGWLAFNIILKLLEVFIHLLLGSFKLLFLPVIVLVVGYSLEQDWAVQTVAFLGEHLGTVITQGEALIEKLKTI
ncbi:MAG: hypothetical protein JKY49_12110 [Cohaesibacteraceae bacterium]|nr:hypothetical protein [Cohaesibacteraceae bacterium]MBL4876960.1 hypothetical protein [Cohaesibacteraceae bacterium]